MSDVTPSIDRRQRVFTGLSLLAYAGTVPLANWMISNVGTQQFPDGPHTIPVGFGFDAPSGVLAIGVSLAARPDFGGSAGSWWCRNAVTCGFFQK